MIKFKKILKKVLFYLGAFLAVVVLSAGIKVCLFLMTRPSKNPSDTVPDVTVESNLNKVLNNVLSTSNADLDLDMEFCASENSSPIKLTSNLLLNMAGSDPNAQSPFDDLEMQMSGNLEFNSQLVPYKIKYLNGFIFAELGDFSVKLQTSNISSDLNKILNFALLEKFGINIELPDFSQISLDPSILTFLASNMTEEDIEDGKKLTLNILDYGSVIILTDNNYSPKSIDLSNLNLNGATIRANIKTDLNSEPNNITEPENKEEITDFSSLTKFLESTDSLFEKGYVSGKITVNILGEDLVADYYFNYSDFNNLKAYIKTVVKDKDMILLYQNNKYFFSYGESKYYHTSDINFDELKQSLSFYASKFGITLPEINLDEIKGMLNVENLNQILTLISDLKINENGLDWQKDSYGINLSIKNGEFDILNVHYKDILSINATLNQEIQMPVINEDEFKNTLEENLFNLLNQQIIKNKNLALKADITVGDILINAELKADFNQDILVQITLKAFDNTAVVTLKNDTIYVDVMGVIKAKGTLTEIVDYLKQSDILQLDELSFTTDDLKNIISSIFARNDINIEFVREDNNIEYVSIGKGDVLVNLTAVEFEDILFNEEQNYQSVMDIIKNIKNLVDVLTQSDLSFDINASYASYALTGRVQYVNNKITAQLSTKIFDRDVMINFVDDKLYVEFAELKFYVSTANIKNIIDELKADYDVDLSELIDLSNVDISQILANASIQFDGNNITILYNDIVIKINTATLQIDFEYNSINVNAQLGSKFNLVLEQTDYTDIYLIKDFAKKVYNTYSKQMVSGKIALTLPDFNINLDYFVDFADVQDIKLALKTIVFDKELIINYQSNKVFVTFDNVKYYLENNLNFDEIIDAIRFYAQRFNIDLQKVKFDEIVDLLNGKNLTKLLDYLDGLKFTENSINYQKDNLKFNINAGEDYIDNLSLNFADKLSCNVSLNEQVDIAEIVESEYKNIADEKIVRQLYDAIVRDKAIMLNADVKINDTLINCKLKIDFTQSILAQLSINVLDKTIIITFDQDTIYVDVMGLIKAKATLTEVLDYLKQAGIFDLDTVEISKDTIQDLLNSQALKNIVINFIEQSEGISKIQVEKDNLSCELSIADFETITFNKSDNYQNLVWVIKNVYSLYEKISSNGLMFNLSANYKEYTLSGTVQYVQNKLQAQFTTQIIGKTLSLEVDDNQIYINFDGLKFSCSFNNIKNILDELKTEYNVDLTAELDNINLDNILSEVAITFAQNGLELTYKDILISIDSQNFAINLSKGDITASVTLGESIALTEKQGYIDIYQLKDVAKATYNTLKNLSVSGNIEVTLNLFGEDNLLNIDYAVGYVDEKLIGYVFTNFKGLDINAYLDNKDIYINVVGLKVHFNIDDLDEIIQWVNDIFNANINFDINSTLNTDNLIDKLKEISFDIIKSLSVLDNKLSVTFTNDLLINVDYDQYVTKVEFEQSSKKAVLTCTDFDIINLDKLNKSEYKDYTIFTELLTSANNLISSKQYKITAGVDKYNAGVRQDHIDANIALDITSMLGANLQILGLGEQIDINYEQKVLYLCYGGENGLKICIQENALQEILSIVLTAMGVDIDSIPMLKDFLQKADLDTGNISSIMPEIDLGNPLVYLEYIDNFQITETCFIVTLKAEKLGTFAHGKDIAIKLNYSGSKITGLQVDNLYLNPDADEYLNISVVLNDFTNLNLVADKDKYIDLSDSKDLIRAFINTSSLNDYNIAGKVKLSINVLGEINAATVDVDVRVKKQVAKQIVYDEVSKEYVEVEKTSWVGMIKISNYPIIGGVNNVNTNSSLSLTRKRTIAIYFKDGDIYLSTVDEKTTTVKQLSRATKITSSYLFGNLKYYIQYLLGFTDTIQNKINEAIDLSMSYTGTTDYGNIIQEYSKSGNAHTIKVNLAELTHNSDIGTLSVVLTILNSEETNNKDYLYRLDMDLRLLDDLLILQTDNKSQENALYLKNIGQSVDVSEMENFITLYDDVYGFGLDGEYEKEGSGDWKQANTGSTTITFMSQGNVLDEKTGDIASLIEMPNMSNIVVDDNITRIEYKFDGWFYDEAFTSQFTSKVFPRYSTVLYAKWSILSQKTYAQISFVTNQENVAVESITGFIGDELSLPVCANVEKIIDENTSSLMTFAGWYTSEGELYSATQFESQQITLYAHWNEIVTKTYNLTIYNANAVVYSGKVASDSEFNLNSLSCYTASSLVYTDSNFAENTLIDNFVVSNHSTWYIRNKYTVTIISSYSSSGKPYKYEAELYEKSNVSLTMFDNYSTENASYTTEYTFNGYLADGSEQIITSNSVVTPAKNVVYQANWSVIDYCMVTFDVCWSRPSGWLNDGKAGTFTTVSNTNDTNQIRIVRNSSINFSDYVAKAKNFKYGLYYDFETVAWSTEPDNINVGSYKGDSSLVITANITLKPIWKADGTGHSQKK